MLAKLFWESFFCWNHRQQQLRVDLIFDLRPAQPLILLFEVLLFLSTKLFKDRLLSSLNPSIIIWRDTPSRAELPRKRRTLLRDDRNSYSRLWSGLLQDVLERSKLSPHLIWNNRQLSEAIISTQ